MTKKGTEQKNRFSEFFHKIRMFFGRVHNRIIHHKLVVLVMMQLKDKWNISFKTDKKTALFKLVGQLIIFGVMIFVVHLIMDISAQRLAIFVSNRIPLNAMYPILTVVVFFEIVSILFGLTKALFFAKDNVVLITYPVNSDYLFLSKIIVYYIDAIKKSFMLLLPLFISFGIIYNYPVYYYFWVVFLDLVFVAFLVLLCAVLAIPTFFVLKFLDKYKVIKLLVSLAILGLFVYLAVLLIGVIPNNINLIREYEKFSKGLNYFLYWYEENISFMAALGHMFFGVQKGILTTVFSKYSWLVLLIVIGAIVALVFVNKYLSKPFYNKMIASSRSNSGGKHHERKNTRYPRWLSVLHYEFLRNFRDQKIIVSSIICVVVMPLITLIFNRVYASFQTRIFGDLLIVVFNFLFVMIVAMSHNVSSSYIFSKDGPSWSINKTMPVDAKLSLSLRLVYNFLVSLLIIIPSSILIFQTKHAENQSCVIFILTLITLSTLHSVISASYDLSHGENKDKADIGSEIIGTHSAISLGVGFLISLASALFLVIASLKVSTHPQTRLFILSLVMLAIALFYFFRKIHLTYQEN